MKKFSIALAVLLAASLSAQAQSTTTANVMGYTKITTPVADSFTLVALTQFSDGTTNSSFDIQGIISNLDNLNSDGLGSSAVGSDKMYVYDGFGYDQYALFSDGINPAYWASVSEGGWIPGLEFLGVTASTNTINRGSACWIQTGAGGTPTNALSSGDVFSDDTFDVTVSSGFSLIAYPYSSSINLTNLVITGAVGSGLGSSATGADKLYVYDGSGYDQYALFDDGINPAYWASVSEGGWIPGLEFLGVNPANATIELGNGFWFETAAEKTIGFEKNYSLN